MSGTFLFRLTAVLLLLLTGTELFACEILAPEQCESFGSPPGQQSEDSGDDCMCCCGHVMVTGAPQLFVIAESLGEFYPVNLPAVEREAAPVYHPPRV